MEATGRIVLALLLCFAFVGSAAAEKRVALLFSASKYEHLRALANPGNDADAIEAVLDRLGFDVTVEANRDLRRMRRALEDFQQDAAGADVALVYFAGHGVEIDGENRLLPVDADAASLARLKETSLPLEEVRATAAATAKSVLILLDACRNDPFGQPGPTAGRSAAALSPGADVLASAKPGLGRIGRAENTLFAFAAAPGETASDGDGENSPFSGALAQYLQTEGLEIRSVLTLVQQAVYDETRGVQLPYVESGLPSLFFATQTGPLPERERLLLAMADVTPDLRTEVETVANANSMPLAPLYGALIAADLKTSKPDDRTAKLAEAAQAFVKTRQELTTLASIDPEVTKLRADAEKSLALGAFDEARNALVRAAKIDSASSDLLAEKLVARRLSEAASHQALAGVALAHLDYPAAVDAFEEAASLHASIEREQIADADRGVRDWLLCDLAGVYSRSGLGAKAFDAFERMEAASRLRLEFSQDNPEARRDVFLAMFNVAQHLGSQGNFDGASSKFNATLLWLEAILEDYPDSPVFHNSYGVTLLAMSRLESSRGDLPEALDYARHSLSSISRANRLLPNNPELLAIFASAYERVGSLQIEQGDMLSGIAALQDAVAISQQTLAMAANNPLNGRLVSALQVILADGLRTVGDLRAAAVEFEAADRGMAPLLEADPKNAELQYVTALIHIAKSLALYDGAQPEAAKAAVLHAQKLMQPLLVLDPESRDRQYALSVVQCVLGELQFEAQDLEAALASYRQAPALSGQAALLPADANPGETELAEASCRRGLAEVLLASGDLAAAQSEVQSARDLGLRLVDHMPTKVMNNSQLSEAYRVLSDLQRARGDGDAAGRTLQAMHQAATLAASAAPLHAEIQVRLAKSHLMLAEEGLQPRQNLEAALGIVDALKAKDRLVPREAKLPALLREKLAALK